MVYLDAGSPPHTIACLFTNSQGLVQYYIKPYPPLLSVTDKRGEVWHNVILDWPLCTNQLLPIQYSKIANKQRTKEGLVP